MYFEENRLLFEVHRVAVIDPEYMAGWLRRRRPQLLRSQDELAQDPSSQMLPKQQQQELQQQQPEPEPEQRREFALVIDEPTPGVPE